jgi:hypothetical protein
MGEFGGPCVLLPGGVRVNKSKFTEADNIRQINSGILLGRRGGASEWEPVPNALTTNLATTLTAAVTAGATVLSVETVSGYRAGDSITIGASNYTIATNGVNSLAKTLTITTGIAAGGAALGAALRLQNAVDMDDFYLLAFDIVDANRNADATLYRHNGLVYLNYLPDYPFVGLSAVQAKIVELYETTMGA